MSGKKTGTFGEGLILWAALAFALIGAGVYALSHSPSAAVYAPNHVLEIEVPLTDINTATAHELAKLPGLGDALAGRIIEYRETVGAFRNIEEILEVSGIGESKFEALKALISVKG